jgi:preprotein translocase subunit SecG
MIIIVTVIHILTSIGLILVVLLQQGKGAEMGAVFGGSSSTIFGSSGAGNFLTRLTTGMAIVFMITSLTLGYFAGRRPSATIFDNRARSVEPRTAPQSSLPGNTPGGRAGGAPATASPAVPQSGPQQKKATP